MAKNIKRFALLLCLLALCVGTLGVTAFAAYDPVTAEIPVEVALTGTQPAKADTFQVELTADDPAYPMPEGAVDGKFVLNVVGASSSDFVIEFDKLGVYSYTVQQLDLGNPDCYQDKSVFKLTAFVTNNEDYDAYDLTVVAYRDDEPEKQDILFNNRYANPTVAQLTATKTMDKKAPADGAFSFELVDASGKVVQTVTNKGGDVTFAPFLCNKVGSSTYTLREVIGTDSKIIYDKTQYTATIDVSKDSNGDYVAKVSYKQGDNAVTGVPAFVNQTKPIIPQTGDNSNIALWGGIMVVALAAIVVVLIIAKKKKNA